MPAHTVAAGRAVNQFGQTRPHRRVVFYNRNGNFHVKFFKAGIRTRLPPQRLLMIAGVIG
jgi:hypothetical protein